jgi:hypothetical protein
MKSNLPRLIGFAAVLVLLQSVANHYPKVFVNINWLTIAATQGVLFVALGAVAFRFYVGSGWTRLGFTIAIPVIANSVLEVITEPDSAYPFLLLALIVPYAIAFGIGGGLMALINRASARTRDEQSAQQ